MLEVVSDLRLMLQNVIVQSDNNKTWRHRGGGSFDSLDSVQVVNVNVWWDLDNPDNGYPLNSQLFSYIKIQTTRIEKEFF